MFALKFFNLRPLLYRDLLQFPIGHEQQSTKFSRCHQRENGSTGGIPAPHLVTSRDQA
jgi:hypothetical protein